MKRAGDRDVWLPEGEVTGRRRSYGAMVVDGDGLVLLRSPTNHYGGYVWTLAKGGPRAHERPEQTALRELQEETGVVGRVVHELAGWFVGDTSVLKVFIASVARDLGTFDRETQEVRWVSFERARELISLTESERGRARDLAVLDAVEKATSLPATTPLDSA